MFSELNRQIKYYNNNLRTKLQCFRRWQVFCFWNENVLKWKMSVAGRQKSLLIKSGAETWHHIVHLYTFYIEMGGSQNCWNKILFLFPFCTTQCRIYIRYCRLMRFLNNQKLVTLHFASIFYNSICLILSYACITSRKYILLTVV